MPWPLRQSSASQEIPLGPFVSSTDGSTAQTGLTIANTDIKLFKSGATSEANKNSGGATHIASGRYYAVLDATDTDTVGPMRVSVHVAGALPVWLDCQVLTANQFDSLVSGSDTLQVDVTQVNNVNAATTTAHFGVNVVQISTDSTAADNCEAFFDGTGYAGTNNVIPTVTSVTNAVSANVTQISGDTTAADNCELFFDGTGYNAANSTVGTVTSLTNGVNVTSISGDSAAADNAEAFFDGTGYAGTNNVIPTVTNVTNAVSANVTQISGDTTAADNAEAFFDGTGYAGTGNVIPTVTTVTNMVTANVTQISGDSTAADNMEAFYEGAFVTSSVSDATPAVGDFTGAVGLSATDDFYNGCVLAFTSGTNKGISRKVTDYTGASRTFTFAGTTGRADAAFTTAPANGDTFIIIGRIGS